MARDPSFDQTAQKLGWLPQLLCWMAKEPVTCLACGSGDVRPSAQRGRFDAILACVYLMPFRCRTCRARFFRLSVARKEQPAVRTRAPLLVMPARGSVAEAPPRIDWEPPASVLILDSDRAIRRLLRRILERSGYTARELATAADLEPELRAGEARLLLADFGLPSQEELERAAALVREHPDLKILELSSQADARPFPAGVLVLPKPFGSEALLAGVRRLLEPGDAAGLRRGPSPVSSGNVVSL